MSGTLGSRGPGNRPPKSIVRKAKQGGLRHGRWPVQHVAMLTVVLVIAAVVVGTRGSRYLTGHDELAVPALSISGIALGSENAPALVRTAATETTGAATLKEAADAATPAVDAAAPTPFTEDVTVVPAASRLRPGAGAFLVADSLITPRPTKRQPVTIPYEVQDGDTAMSIAERFGVSLSNVLYANPEIVDPAFLIVGQRMVIPGKDGLIYSIRLGDTIRSIAREFDVKSDAIVDYSGNKLQYGDELVEGTQILIPGVVAPMPEPAETPTPEPIDTTTPVDTPVETPYPTDTPVDTPVVTDTPVPTDTPAPTGGRFAWPVTGPISSYFGPSHPLGIDIDLYGRDGAPIGASAAGTVIFSGGDPCCSYGLYVQIQHDGGFVTTYAHLSGLAVSVGDRVGQGVIVGYGGSTGYSTGTHLHFEIWHNGVAEDPLGYLP